MNSNGTNVPQTFRNLTGMKPKRLSTFPNLPIERDHFYFVQENRFWTKSKQSVLNKTNSGTIPKRFGFVSKNDIGTFVNPLPPYASSGTPTMSSDEEAAVGV